jgi:AcrR family transcriptional regulator
MGSFFCRPKADMRRTSILEVAREVFCHDGYAATSMSSIAARLGGSKATLYKYFRSKEELFAASLEDLIETHAVLPVLPAVAAGGDLEKTLIDLCYNVTTAMLSPPLLALFRLVVSESPRFPELGQAYYEKVVAPGQQRVAQFLQSCVDGGLIKPTDPLTAAGLLFALCRNNNCFRMLANLLPAPTAAALRDEAELAARTFLAAFRIS